MATEMVHDDEPVTRDEIRLAIASLNSRAKREMRVVGSPKLPTPWDVRHAQINLLLEELEFFDVCCDACRAME